MYLKNIMKLTIKIKLLPTDEQKILLLQTMQKFNEACNYISAICFKKQLYNKIAIHKIVYYDVRKRFNLSAQMAVRAIGKVVESYKTDKKKKSIHKFKKYSAMVFDERILTFKSLDSVSILTLTGREIMPFVVGEYAKLSEKRVLGQADLIYKNGNLFLCVVVDIPDKPLNEAVEFLGVDLGIVNIAVDSTGKSFSGDKIAEVKQRRNKHKAQLQKKGTKSAKRRLKKLSGKIRGFVKDTNHCISKHIVEKAKALGLGIALEKLTKIKKTVRKSFRERFEQWSFYELQAFIKYKAQLAGIPVVEVDPRYTSQMCSHCGFVSKKNRRTQSKFVCQSCGFETNADFNAAINIAAKALVNKPIVTASGVTSPLLQLGVVDPRPQ